MMTLCLLVPLLIDLGEDTTLRDDGETAILSATAPMFVPAATPPTTIPAEVLIPESDTSVMGVMTPSNEGTNGCYDCSSKSRYYTAAIIQHLPPLPRFTGEGQDAAMTILVNGQNYSRREPSSLAGVQMISYIT